jgi:uncharacterized cupin superfamily protein
VPGPAGLIGRAQPLADDTLDAHAAGSTWAWPLLLLIDTGDGHNFLNETDKEAVFLVVGDRTPGDEVSYSDIDLELKRNSDGKPEWRHKDGEPYQPQSRN